MCSTFIIGGKYCETGADLIKACGEETARWLNRLYDLEGQPQRRHNEAGEVEQYQLSAQDIARNCLCHVDQNRLEKTTGKKWMYSLEDDTYFPVEE